MALSLKTKEHILRAAALLVPKWGALLGGGAALALSIGFTGSALHFTTVTDTHGGRVRILTAATDLATVLRQAETPPLGENDKAIWSQTDDGTRLDILRAYTVPVTADGTTQEIITTGATAAELLAQKLADKGCPEVIVHDLARCDMAKAVEDAFRYGKLVLATTTYNADVFPFMKEFIHHLTERNFQNRTIGLMENGSWAPLAAKTMRKMLEGSKNLTFTDTTVKILSALNDDSKAQIESMANELCKDYLARQDETANKNNLDALFNIGYGLYVVTSSDGSKDNGLIVNTVSQVTNTPNRIAVTINKQNYSHHVIKQTGVMNVCCLDTSAPFSVFQTFGFQSGRTADKFAGVEELRSDNGLRFLPRYINSFMSLKVESYVDLDTHGMFICSVTEARVISDRETMTYTYYQNNVKPKPETEGKHGFVCKVCGWIYEGDTLPDDIVCPLCKHGAADFEPIG